MAFLARRTAPGRLDKLMKKQSGAVIPIPQSRERNLLLRAVPDNNADSSTGQRTPDFGMTSACPFPRPAKWLSLLFLLRGFFFVQ